jgi:hypothetical protein
MLATAYADAYNKRPITNDVAKKLLDDALQLTRLRRR